MNNHVSVRRQSFKFKFYFYLLTLPVLLYLLVLVSIAAINPIQRQDFMNFVEIHIHKFIQWRWNRLKPIYRKDNLFSIIKESDK